VTTSKRTATDAARELNASDPLNVHPPSVWRDAFFYGGRLPVVGDRVRVNAWSATGEVESVTPDDHDPHLSHLRIRLDHITAFGTRWSDVTTDLVVFEGAA
jgi:hypothetical protein